MKLPFLVALPLVLSATLAQAQRPAQENIDASKLPESGPLVTGGGGTTAGPNSRNQAVSPMPGTREEELSELPRTVTLPAPPPVRPVPGNPTRQPPVAPSR